MLQEDKGDFWGPVITGNPLLSARKIGQKWKAICRPFLGLTARRHYEKKGKVPDPWNGSWRSILQTLRVAWVRTKHAQAEFLPCSTILKFFWTWFTCFWVHSFTYLFSRRDTSPGWPTFHLHHRAESRRPWLPLPSSSVSSWAFWSAF